VRGCCASAGGAITLFAATYLGIPISTTHTVSGAVIGVGAAVRKVSAVRLNIAANIVIAWIVTLGKNREPGYAKPEELDADRAFPKVEVVDGDSEMDTVILCN
jgi:Phosphate transporter family